MSRSVNLDGLTRDAGDPSPGDLVRERLDIQRVMHRDRVVGPAGAAGAGECVSTITEDPDDQLGQLVTEVLAGRQVGEPLTISVIEFDIAGAGS